MDKKIGWKHDLDVLTKVYRGAAKHLDSVDRDKGIGCLEKRTIENDMAMVFRCFNKLMFDLPDLSIELNV